MKHRIGITQMNSILEAAKQDDDVKAILEGMITEPGISIVQDSEAPVGQLGDVSVMFMYPAGARASQHINIADLPALDDWLSKSVPL